MKFRTFSMKKLDMFLVSVSFCFMFCYHVKAQSSSGSNVAAQDAVSAFKPSLALVIGVLSIMFSLTFLLLIYAKFCHRESSSSSSLLAIRNQTQILMRSRSQLSGIDKKVIESLPFFRFSSLKGSKEGLECAVCLSKFEDVEILRLLPKCKHAFHINCIDQWLEKHSSCPLCRLKINVDDPAIFTYSNSLRFLWNHQAAASAASSSGQLMQDSNLELFVQREEEDDRRNGSFSSSSRFKSIIGSSFRKAEKNEEAESSVLIQTEPKEGSKAYLNKFNHRIIVSGDMFFRNRWSSVSSSDLMFLNSEMISATSSDRFSSLETKKARFEKRGDPESGEEVDVAIMNNIKEECEKKRALENKINNSTKLGLFSGHPNTNQKSRPRKSLMVEAEKRSMSEITVVSRFDNDSSKKNRVLDQKETENESNVKEERMRKLWLPIARRTVQWFANREERKWSLQQPHPQNHQNTTEPLDV